MATQQRGFSIGNQLALIDLRAKQFTAVKVTNASGIAKIDVNVTSGGKILGVLQNKPNIDEPADVMVLGVTKWVAGAAVVIGPVMSDAAGKAIAAATTGSTIAGYALTAAGALNEIIDVLMLPCVGVV